MDNETGFSHGWYSQLGQSRSTQSKRPGHTSPTSLASYLPSEPISPVRGFERIDRDVSSIAIGEEKELFSPNLPQARRGGTKGIDRHATTGHYHTAQAEATREGTSACYDENPTRSASVLETSHNYRCREYGNYFVAEYNRSPKGRSIPRFEETRHTQEKTIAYERVTYPNMLDTHFGTVPTYSAPAWLEQSDFKPSTAPFASKPPQIVSRSKLSYKTRPPRFQDTPDSVSHESTRFKHMGSRAQTLSPPPLPPRKETYEPLLEVNAAPYFFPEQSSGFVHELEARELSPVESPSTSYTSTNPYAYFPMDPQSASTTRPEDCANTLGQQPKVNKGDIQLGGGAAHGSETSSRDKTPVGQSAGIQSTGFRSVENLIDLNESVHSTNSGRSASAEKSVKFDNFYTPANEQFYNAKPYTKLNQELKEIRLLRVSPKRSLVQQYKLRPNWNISHAGNLAKGETLIACEIEKTSLTRIADNFVTLSYCAGDPKKTAVILVDGIPFNAFANLEHAIDRVITHWMQRHPDGEPLLLWADQISINQSDKNERSNQVQIMRDIYRRSSETYVCLSEPQLENCLAWVPRGAALSNSQSNCVVDLQKLLLNVLIGKENAEYLLSTSDSVLKTDVVPLRTKGSLIQIARKSVNPRPVSRQNSLLLGLSERHRDRNYKTPGTFSRSSTRLSDVGFLDLEQPPISAVEFQSSLIEFLTNKWWRRYVNITIKCDAKADHTGLGFIKNSYPQISSMS
jgi:hypothetical protein